MGRPTDLPADAGWEGAGVAGVMVVLVDQPHRRRAGRAPSIDHDPW